MLLQAYGIDRGGWLVAVVGLVAFALGGCKSNDAIDPQPDPTTIAVTTTVSTAPATAFGIALPSGGKAVVARSLDESGKATAHLALKANPGSYAALRVFIDGVEVATLQAPTFETELRFDRDGARAVVVKGYDASGAERETAALSVEVSGGCLSELERSGVNFRLAPSTKGITDPVYVGPQVDGVALRYRTSSKPDAILVACEMVGHVRRLAGLVKSMGFDEIVHIGTYNYRNMRNPTCEKNNSCKLSQHSYGTALDIHAIAKAGTKLTYSTLKDWVVTPMPTCPGKAKTEGDKALHSLACQMRAKNLFSIILTPNYNATHRDHFHVDLTANSATIRGDYTVDPEDPEVWDE